MSYRGLVHVLSAWLERQSAGDDPSTLVTREAAAEVKATEGDCKVTEVDKRDTAVDEPAAGENHQEEEDGVEGKGENDGGRHIDDHQEQYASPFADDAEDKQMFGRKRRHSSKTIPVLPPPPTVPHLLQESRSEEQDDYYDECEERPRNSDETSHVKRSLARNARRCPSKSNRKA